MYFYLLNINPLAKFSQNNIFFKNSVKEVKKKNDDFEDFYDLVTSAINFILNFINAMRKFNFES